MTTSVTATLPYGPILRRVLRPVQRGFLIVNRWLVRPMLRSPFGRFVGNPVTGHLLLLRTRGRRTGLAREVPLGYVILDGSVYSVAGYGVGTPWYRNLLDNPTVQVVLPGRTMRGIAEPVTDDAEWLRAYRALIGSFGLVGRLVDGDPRRLDDAELLATHRSLPVVRIRSLDPPGPVSAGPWDPGGRGWLVSYGTIAAGLILVVGLRWIRAASTPTAPRRQTPPRPSA